MFDLFSIDFLILGDFSFKRSPKSLELKIAQTIEIIISHFVLSEYNTNIQQNTARSVSRSQFWMNETKLLSTTADLGRY